MIYRHDQHSCGAIRLRLLVPNEKYTPYLAALVNKGNHLLFKFAWTKLD